MELTWKPGDRTVSWRRDGQLVVKEFLRPVQSAVAVDSPPSVVVVEQAVEHDVVSNAVVYELDGRERVRLRAPAVAAAIGFDQVFASPSGLVAVFAARGGDLQGIPDLLTGELRGLREWR